MSYKEFFYKSERASTQRSQIGLLKGEGFEAFIKRVVNDGTMPGWLKFFILVGLSGGCRVNEVRALKKKDFSLEDNRLFFKVTVLKKRRYETRTCVIHPLATLWVKEYLDSKVGELLTQVPSTIRRALEVFEVEGLTCHSLRHSQISYLLFNSKEKMTHIEVAKLNHVSVKVVELYAHLDEKRVLKKIF